MIKCACGDPFCKNEIAIDPVSHTLLMEGGRLIYLNAENTRQLIEALNEALVTLESPTTSEAV